uniref:hydroxyisourate hydrolase n=1 Tax=Timema shepardi TaxID=629360 RepID=A0A7R9ATB2_TIMSH|nr:unnamed protein product [Timema shepardi]
MKMGTPSPPLPEFSKEESEFYEDESPESTPNKLMKRRHSGYTGATPVKYYKQAYRKEWEKMPDFKGWLRCVPGESNRAYCKYCEKTLHAHRLSLLKHTCTLKHTNAAERVYALEQASKNSSTFTTTLLKSLKVEGNESKSMLDPLSISPGKMSNKPETGKSTVNKGGTAKETEDYSFTGGDEEDDDEEEEEEEDEHNNSDSDVSPQGKLPHDLSKEVSKQAPKKVIITTVTNMGDKEPTPLVVEDGPLSTHVLDTSKGRPVGGLLVSLYKLIDGRWTHLHDGATNPDGRYAGFMKSNELSPGRYKLHFDVDHYYEPRRIESFYPFIEVVFDVKSPQSHYHVPLLLSPFGYTTYRGS